VLSGSTLYIFRYSHYNSHYRVRDAAGSLKVHTLLRAGVIIFLVVAVPTAYGIISMKVAGVYPRIGRVLITLFLSVGYGFIATIVAAVFFGSHVGVILLAPLMLASIPKAWKDAKAVQSSE